MPSPLSCAIRESYTLLALRAVYLFAILGDLGLKVSRIVLQEIGTFTRRAGIRSVRFAMLNAFEVL